MILGGCGYFAFYGKMCDEFTDLLYIHILWMTLFMENYVAFDPIYVGLFGAIGVMLGPKCFTDLIE